MDRCLDVLLYERGWHWVIHSLLSHFSWCFGHYTWSEWYQIINIECHSRCILGSISLKWLPMPGRPLVPGTHGCQGMDSRSRDIDPSMHRSWCSILVCNIYMYMYLCLCVYLIVEGSCRSWDMNVCCRVLFWEMSTGLNSLHNNTILSWIWRCIMPGIEVWCYMKQHSLIVGVVITRHAIPGLNIPWHLMTVKSVLV